MRSSRAGSERDPRSAAGGVGTLVLGVLALNAGLFALCLVAALILRLAG
jgi:hypothetical protein